MDAKPQRPMRTLRVHDDENLLPSLPANKALHSRNKSSPALSTMANAANIRATMKRGVLNDLGSGMVNSKPIRDDSAIPTKARYEVSEKSSLWPQDKKAAALLRPAQRPLSISNLKGLLNNPTNTSVIGISKSVGETQQALQPSNTRKLLTKRNNAVFRDVSLPKPEQILNIEKRLPTKAPVAPVHRDLNILPEKSGSEYLEGPLQSLPKIQVTSVSETEETYYEEMPIVPALIDTHDVIRSDGVFIDDNGDVRVCEYTDETDQVEQPLDIVENALRYSEEVQIVENAYDYCQPEVIQNPSVQSEALRKSTLPLVSEPEEYWDEDEDEDNYDEEGYVTARSYKSRGDNTTGGGVTIVPPKVNNKVKKEIAAAKEVVESTRTPDDIEDEAYDTSMVAEYGEEIFEYMRELEIKMLPNTHYMDNQAEIQWSMRSVLMDWLVQVHHRFALLPETLFLCVNYIDRFLSSKVVSLGKLQLVGATAIFVAAKYEEINCPSVAEIVYMVDGGYTIDEILKAERFMLSMLQFELGWPGPMSFLRRISKADDYDLETRTLAKYFLEVTIMDERFLGSPPSFSAAGAHCLARMMLKKGSWSPHHVYYSNYTYSQLYPLVQLMLECCETPKKHHAAIYEKYQSSRYKTASSFVEKEIQDGFRPHNVASNSTATFLSFYDEHCGWNRK